MIVLDGSGSMWGQIDGTTKIQIARNVLRDVLGSMPADTELGLVVYGHREEGNCADIEVAIPAGAGTAGRISQFADRINPKGKTPLTDAVRVAAEELSYQTVPTKVVLITDGIETCQADPCALGRLLEAQGTDIAVHVVGFGISDEAARKVACLAEETGGRYLGAADADELSEALTIAVTPETESGATDGSQSSAEPGADTGEAANNLTCIARLAEGAAPMAGNDAVRWEFFPLDEDGNPTGENQVRINDGVCETRLPPGRYLAQARLGNILKERKIGVPEDGMTQVEAIFDAGHVVVTARHSAQDTRPMQEAHIELSSRDGVTNGQGSISTYVSAGPVTATGRAGTATAVENRELSAGEEMTIDLFLGSGTVLPSATYAEGGPKADDDRISYDLLEAEPNSEGEHAIITQGDGSAGFEVPTGRYLLRGKLGQAEATTPVFVKPGKTTQATVNLDAGSLYVKAPSALRIEFFDAFGTKIYSGTDGEEAEEVFNAGAYQVRVTYGRGTPERYLVATVEAGRRTEVAVEYRPLTR